ncbi:MAG: ABC transporter permease subunit [Hyphomicrobiales bacterium]|nr:ABC transporter permease subunit [Hyphomicrobiales bacterium]
MSAWRVPRLATLLVGFAFLYAPIVLLVVYSFNASRLATVWTGFSTHWYAALLADEQMRGSALISLEVAALSAAIATVLGALAALALERFGGFRTRSVFVAAIYAPLVMPEVILGLSLLLLFVAIGAPRGFWTIVAGHATFSMCFAAVVIRARLAGADRSLEEAAMDLGAGPVATFMRITLPLAMPAVISAYMLAFILSMDDLVIASFTSGPGATTLPMRIYSAVRLGVSPEINAISSLLLGAVGVALLIGAVAQARRTNAA